MGKKEKGKKVQWIGKPREEKRKREEHGRQNRGMDTGPGGRISMG